MAQPCISGREFTCSVLQDGSQLTSLPITEIIPNNADFFDYNAKYLKGGSQEITPAKISSKLQKEIQEIAVKAHKTLGCSGYSRTDFLEQDGKLFLLEINTLPGLTSTSLLPQQAKAAGIEFTDLLDMIIKASLKYQSVEGARKSSAQ